MAIIEDADIPEVLREAAGDNWLLSCVEAMYCATWRSPYKCGCELYVLAATAEELAERMRRAETGTWPGDFYLSCPGDVKHPKQHSR